MKYYVTLTGLNYRFGTQPFTVGQKVKLVKEPENDFDREAIRAELPGLGKVGYVANSTHTVLGDCYSAGRIYDKIGAAATAKVKYVLANAVVCSVKGGGYGADWPAAGRSGYGSALWQRRRCHRILTEKPVTLYFV